MAAAPSGPQRPPAAPSGPQRPSSVRQRPPAALLTSGNTLPLFVSTLPCLALPPPERIEKGEEARENRYGRRERVKRERRRGQNCSSCQNMEIHDWIHDWNRATIKIHDWVSIGSSRFLPLLLFRNQSRPSYPQAKLND